MESETPVPVVLETPVEVAEELPPAPAAPIESRFLYVDVAALRAKQLRRGARPRVPEPERPCKPERLAMQEVDGRLVHWSLPPLPSRPTGSDTL